MDGNLLEKISPAPNQTGTTTQSVSYCYDELHRVTGRAYSAQTCQSGQLPAGTAVVSYVYDQGANGIGHLSSMTDQAGTATYNYDILGRLSSEQRTLPGVSGPVSKTVSYDYNLDGSLKALHYPSGAVVTYTLDSAGRIVSAVDNGNNINYVTGATFGPDSALTGFVSGSSTSFAGITNSFTYNKRLQPVNMAAVSPTQTVFSINYDFHFANGNNGNVWGIINNKDASRSQTFTYDPLNRLTSAQNAGTNCAATTANGKTEYWGNSYSYDAWGNLLGKTITKCGAENLSVSANVKNQLYTGSAGDYAYDTAGNMTHDATSGLNYAYDQENRITGAGGYIYTYDGDGNRVEKSNGSTASSGTLYWYMTPGIVAESDLAGTLKSEYVFLAGKRVARRDLVAPAGVFYYFSDYLKTASVITDSVASIKAESDYYPWGGELQFVNIDSNHYKFTGEERDSESGLDYFGKRYYGNSFARWTSPDPINLSKKHIASPQRWNKYTYVQSNPIGAIDPDGLDDFKIFLVYTKEVEQSAPHTDWGQVKKTLEKQGHTVSIVHYDDAKGKDFKDALRSDSHVVFVGHTVRAHTKATAVKMRDATVGDGKTDSVNLTFNPGATPDAPPVISTQWLAAMPVGTVTAPTVGIFGCDSLDLAGQYSTTTFTAVDSGADKLTSVNALDLAAGQYVLDLGAGKDRIRRHRMQQSRWNRQIIRPIKTVTK